MITAPRCGLFLVPLPSLLHVDIENISHLSPFKAIFGDSAFAEIELAFVCTLQVVAPLGIADNFLRFTVDGD